MGKKLLSIILTMAVLIFGGVSEMSVVLANVENTNDNGMVIIEKENVDIDNHHYEYISYYKDRNNQSIRIISLKTKEEELVIPSEIDSWPVVALGGKSGEFFIGSSLKYDNLFPWQMNENQVLKKIIVPEGVTEIVGIGFMNTKADSIELPKSLKIIGEMIGNGGFEKSKISHVIIRGKNTNIGMNAFADSLLKKITLPKDYQGTIASCAFQGSKLETFKWPSYEENVSKKNGSRVFQNCKNLKKVIFPKNQKHIYIPEACFYGCTKLKKLTFPASTKKVTYNWNPYADNYKMGVRTLVFKGKKTKIVGIKRSSKKNKNVLTVGKIIAPKGSKALAYAKKAKRVKWLAKWVQRDIRAYSGPTVNYTDGYDGRAIKYAKMKYSVLKKK